MRIAEHSAARVDLDLVKRYNIPGPRYTSYPPATRFKEQFSKDALLAAVERNNQTRRPLSLYYHLPFCKSLCWFCGCTTVITKAQEQSASYLDYLEREMDAMAARMNPEREVIQLHLGGGTPNFLLPDETRRLGDMIRERFRLSTEIEAGSEVDPREFSEAHVAALRDAGFNRASMGVQDNNPEVQRAINRIQPFEQSKAAVDWLREAGFKSINIDLIYGLPLQTTASFERTLSEVLTLRPDRFAVFNYAHVPWIKPTQNVFKELPSAETKLQLLKLIIETLTDNGYVYIGMDHFAREDDELVIAQRNKTLQRNFQGYSTCGEADIYAFGMSSISQIEDAYWQNQKELPDYYGALEKGEWPVIRGYVLSDEDKLRRETIMRLMCDMELNFSEMSARLGVEFEDHFAAELSSLEDMREDGLIEWTPEGLRVTDAGRLLIRNIAMRFDAYLKGQSTEKRFSKTI